MEPSFFLRNPTGFTGFTRLPCGFKPGSTRFCRFYTPANESLESLSTTKQNTLWPTSVAGRLTPDEPRAHIHCSRWTFQIIHHKMCGGRLWLRQRATPQRMTEELKRTNTAHGSCKNIRRVPVADCGCGITFLNHVSFFEIGPCYVKIWL